jgi:hypothetical protein
MTAPDLRNVAGSVRFQWWCRQCGWWSEVDLCGYCSQCRHNLDRKGRTPTRDALARFVECRRCRS